MDKKLWQISHEQLPYSPKFSIASVFILAMYMLIIAVTVAQMTVMEGTLL